MQMYAISFNIHIVALYKEVIVLPHTEGPVVIFISKNNRRKKFLIRLVTTADYLFLMLESDRAEAVISIVAMLGAYINSY